MEVNLLAPRHRRPPVKQMGLLILLLVVSLVLLGLSWAAFSRGRAAAAARLVTESQVQQERSRREQAAPDPADQALLSRYAELVANRPDFPELLETIATALPASGRLVEIGFTAPGTLTVSGYLPSLQSVAGYMRLLEETGMFASVANPAAVNTADEVHFSLELQAAGRTGVSSNEAK